MFLILFAVSLILIILYAYSMLVKHLDYWQKRNVPHLKPKIFFGNYSEYILMKKCLPEVTSEICKKFPNEQYIGTFFGTEPALIIQDPDIIKLVMQKDFNYFTGREITSYSCKEMFTNLLFFQGGDQWKVLRQNLTPLFTSSKTKNMFPSIKTCATQFESLLEAETSINQEINVRPLLARYTMDCIISCVFGLNANCMKTGQSDNPFVIVGLKIFETSITRGLKMVCRSIWPSVFYGLGFQMFNESIKTFFLKLFTDVSKSIDDRSPKADFFNLILEWKKNSQITGLCFSPDGDKRNVSIEVTDELLTAQCAGFFGGGFETTSSTLCFLLYELAKNQHVQDRVIEEVDDYFQKNNDIINYNCVTDLPYIEACVEEALRLYPGFGTLTREVMHKYTFPTGLSLQRGDRIHIPVYHMHRNSNNFPKPEVYRPERFLGEERNNIKPFTFLPFGEGPRFCMGTRFIKMPIHSAVLTLFRRYKIELAENMLHDLNFQPTSIVLQSATEIFLKFKRRNEN